MNDPLTFYEFIEERLKIYQRKEIRRDPFPWTMDPTLREHKFCNAQRHLDSGTQKLLKYVIENDRLAPEQKIMNIVFYRMFNSRNHFDLFPLVENWGDDTREEMIRECKLWIRDGYKIFNNAYAIRAPKPKYEHIINSLANADYVKIFEDVQNLLPEKAIAVIKEQVKHCGDFIAGQIYLDCTYNVELSPRWTGDDFLIIGPGALEGLKIMYGEDFGGRYPDSIVRHLWEGQPYISTVQSYPRLSRYTNGRLSLMDIQHCLCEYRKYLKWREGKGMCRKYHRN